MREEKILKMVTHLHAKPSKCYKKSQYMLDTSVVYKTVLYNDAVFFRLAASTGCSFNGNFFSLLLLNNKTG